MWCILKPLQQFTGERIHAQVHRLDLILSKFVLMSHCIYMYILFKISPDYFPPNLHFFPSKSSRFNRFLFQNIIVRILHFHSKQLVSGEMFFLKMVIFSLFES